ncbi:unnamed protein product [Cylicocyclus nassatus]|uniref:Uncharacterized protein n=1 Tax=Cylicocyclus nassatus TaxID=53992 RepID=A0AA36H899_CYLNA|nr:unnamed protein product [Cylicocyclus nassatus]
MNDITVCSISLFYTALAAITSMRKTWLLFMKNVIILWRGGVWTLSPVIVPVGVGFIILLILYRDFPERCMSGKENLPKLTGIPLRSKQYQNKTRIFVNKELGDVQQKELLELLEIIQNNSGHVFEVVDGDSRGYSGSVSIKEFDLFTKARYLYRIEDDSRSVVDLLCIDCEGGKKLTCLTYATKQRM